MPPRHLAASLLGFVCIATTLGCATGDDTGSAGDTPGSDAFSEVVGADSVGEPQDTHTIDDEAELEVDDSEPEADAAEPELDDGADATDTPEGADGDTGAAAPDTDVDTGVETDATVGDTADDAGDVTTDADGGPPACEDGDGDGFGEGPGCVAPDCDDDDPRRNLGALERCDGIDNDCDGAVDEDDAVDAELWYRDGDGDGHGDLTRTTLACAAPDGYVADDADCDDLSPLVRPGAAERCDGVDEDCDGAIDEGVADAPLWYLDADGDGFGTDSFRRACTAPVGYVAITGDCHDGDATRFPGAVERCDGADHDCDGPIYDADAIDLATFHRDADGDGFGAAAVTTRACRSAFGWVADASDCDDDAKDVNPGADETCDGEDDDCDGATDEEDAIDATPWYPDGDGDGYGAGTPRMSCTELAGHVLVGLDCDDRDATRHPGAPERCDGVDHDCDGAVNETTSTDARPWHPDRDADGYGDMFLIIMACTAPPGFIADGRDCDDDSPLARPGGTEVCDHRDNDCDGTTDEDAALGAKIWFLDGDGDLHGDASRPKLACWLPDGHAATGDDCDDGDPNRYPGAPEHCGGVDHDCDGDVNEDGSVDAGSWYADDDDDGFGDPLALRKSCSPVAGHVTDARDCDDAAMLVNPDATEVCDTIDNDCDDVIDEDDAADATTWHADGDGDGHGHATDTWVACEAPAGYVASGDDCDDDDDAIHPGASEYCDGVDLDCDGLVDQSDSLDAGRWHLDADNDGYGSAAVVLACVQPAGTLVDASDCDDARPMVHPGAAEICNGLDDDCDPTTREDGLGPVPYRASVPLGGYAGRQLRGANFACQRLAGVSFAGADLRHTSFRQADLRGANFAGADLRWTDLEGADLRGTDLRNTDLTGASMRHARFQ